MKGNLMKHHMLTTIHYKIDNKPVDLICTCQYTCQEDLEVTSIVENLSGKELENLTEQQLNDITFICMESLPDHQAAYAEYLHDMAFPR
jgi:hypothetical protein